MARTPTPSTRFRRAAIAERDRLLRQREKIVDKVAELRAELEKLVDERHALEERIGELSSLAGESSVSPAVPAPTPSENGDQLLRGAAIRETAVRVLLESPQALTPIHYRTWLTLVREAGYEVGGKRPDAVFLNQVVRSPLVKASTKAGIYQLDLDAWQRLVDRLKELQAELRESTTASDPEELPENGSLQDLTLEIERTRRAIEEAKRSLEDADVSSLRAAA